MITAWLLVYFLSSAGKHGGDEQMTLAAFDTQAECVELQKLVKSKEVECIGVTYKQGSVIPLFQMRKWI